MYIGERPGLSATGSLGVYVTCLPRPGTRDSRRNCISNIHNGGLAIDRAAEGVVLPVADVLMTGVSGAGLKDASDKSTKRMAAICGPRGGNRRVDQPRSSLIAISNAQLMSRRGHESYSSDYMGQAIDNANLPSHRAAACRTRKSS
ncbi:ethanolamine ammonia-lyase light chain EutC [Bradyrhizobium sp. CCBAU 53380]|uniref:ethanolamine ammonia-lyase light chain EutC n=1 Tax=Bradyrhizobium sp. CCBAU 53380 TaxID=1325117 RepID=UPI0023044DA0|nr:MULTISPECIES: ethanolamine ammonia-lyase light chain EutC [unclassified Bradyrhizobium]